MSQLNPVPAWTAECAQNPPRVSVLSGADNLYSFVLTGSGEAAVNGIRFTWNPLTTGLADQSIDGAWEADNGSGLTQIYRAAPAGLKQWYINASSDVLYAAVKSDYTDPNSVFNLTWGLVDGAPAAPTWLSARLQLFTEPRGFTYLEVWGYKDNDPKTNNSDFVYFGPTGAIFWPIAPGQASPQELYVTGTMQPQDLTNYFVEITTMTDGAVIVWLI